MQGMTVTADKSVHAGGGIVFDILERALLLLLGLSAIVRLAPQVAHAPHVALILISEGLGVAFILIRRRALHGDYSPYAAAIAFLGTAAPLFVTAPGHPLIPVALGVGIMVAGLLLNISAKVVLNRSFGLAAANRGVKHAGPYRFLRHPMYAGYMTTQAAFLLLNPCPWNLVVYAFAWTVQILRIAAEERILLEDPAYQDYADQVRFRLAPGLY
jgi:protein-S-isoprenylcysteine O-methyltransferase Ste14